MSAVDIFCTILDVCLAKTESNVYFIQVNSEFVYGDTRYNAGDVLDVRNKENFTGNKMSGLWVRNVSESSERYLPSSVKGLFSIRNDLNIGKPVGVKYKRSVPIPPVGPKPDDDEKRKAFKQISCSDNINNNNNNNSHKNNETRTVANPKTFANHNLKTIDPRDNDQRMLPFNSNPRNSNKVTQPSRGHHDNNNNNNKNHYEVIEDVDILKSNSPLFPPKLSSVSRDGESKLRTDITVFLKQIGRYDELIGKKFRYFERNCEESQLLEDFPGDEICARTIYHYLYKGWRPLQHPPQNWREKQAFTFSVGELYMYMMSKQRQVLGGFLKRLRVDGALMCHVLIDDLLLHQILPDRRKISERELNDFRKDFLNFL